MSKKIIKFEIVTPEKVILKENITQITVPTTSGEITILPEHIPLVSILTPGVIDIRREDGSPEILSVSGGFIEVLRDKIVILADTAERAEELDSARVEEARKKAEKTKQEAVIFDKEEFANVRALLAKELARSKAVEKWKKLKKHK